VAGVTRVLILEDSTPVIQSLIPWLEVRGAEYVCAGTVAEALQALTTGPFDFAILDYEVPDGTGLDVLAAIQTLPSKPTTILYSGLDRSAELGKAGLEVDHQISKANPFALLDVLEAE
jgi:CheY-like chemotaxis protein